MIDSATISLAITAVQKYFSLASIPFMMNNEKNSLKSMHACKRTTHQSYTQFFFFFKSCIANRISQPVDGGDEGLRRFLRRCCEPRPPSSLLTPFLSAGPQFLPVGFTSCRLRPLWPASHTNPNDQEWRRGAREEKKVWMGLRTGGYAKHLSLQ